MNFTLLSTSIESKNSLRAPPEVIDSTIKFSFMDRTKKRSRDSCVESAVKSEKKVRRVRQPKATVKSAPSGSVKDDRVRVMDFSYVPCTDSILDFDTEPLESLYETGKVIGEGQFGIVSQAIHHETRRMYACKSISKNSLISRSDKEDVIRELEITASLRGCPQIVSFESVHEDENWIHLVMELCSGGELFDEINRVSSFPESTSAQIFHQIVKGVLHCHERGILHHDLKPENILLSELPVHHGNQIPVIKLADFGLAVALSPKEKMKGRSGSPFYMAPEVLDGMYGLSADIWSLGVILYILLSGSPPFFGDDDESTYRAIHSNDLKFNGPLWKTISEEAKSLIRQILNRDPSERPTAFEILNHPWLAQYCYLPSSPSELCQTPELNLDSMDFVSSSFSGASLPSDYEFKTPQTNHSQVQVHSSFWSNSPFPEAYPSPMSFANSSISSLDLTPHPLEENVLSQWRCSGSPFQNVESELQRASSNRREFIFSSSHESPPYIPTKKRSRRIVNRSSPPVLHL